LSLAAVAVALLCLIPSRLDSDALVITKAMTASTMVEIWVEEGSIVVELEIGVISKAFATWFRTASSSGSDMRRCRWSEFSSDLEVRVLIW
jgi:hypothetical protein